MAVGNKQVGRDQWKRQQRKFSKVYPEKETHIRFRDSKLKKEIFDDIRRTEQRYNNAATLRKRFLETHYKPLFKELDKKKKVCGYDHKKNMVIIENSNTGVSHYIVVDDKDKVMTADLSKLPIMLSSIEDEEALEVLRERLAGEIQPILKDQELVNHYLKTLGRLDTINRFMGWTLEIIKNYVSTCYYLGTVEGKRTNLKLKWDYSWLTATLNGRTYLFGKRGEDLLVIAPQDDVLQLLNKDEMGERTLSEVYANPLEIVTEIERNK